MKSRHTGIKIWLNRSSQVQPHHEALRKAGFLQRELLQVAHETQSEHSKNE